MYVDGGFHSADVHDSAKDGNIEIHLTNMSGTEPTMKIPVTGFDIDENTKNTDKHPAPCQHQNLPQKFPSF
jgi:hypothetical protein